MRIDIYDRNKKKKNPNGDTRIADANDIAVGYYIRENYTILYENKNI